MKTHIKTRPSKFLTILVLLSLPAILNTTPLYAEITKDKPVIIGIVTDGSSENLKKLPEIFLNELLVMTDKEFQVETPLSKQLDGGWSVEAIKKAIDTLENDPLVDIVLALGPAASNIAVMKNDFVKPTFAPFIINDKLLGFSRADNKSGIKNLNYLTNSGSLDEELATFLSVAPATRLSMLMDNTLYESIPDNAKQMALNIAKKKGLELSFDPSGADVQELISMIGADTQSIILAPLPRLDDISKKTLIEELIARKLPSLSWAGETGVEEGILMSTQPSSDFQRIARRMALNIHAVMRGEEAGDQPVLFERKRQLRINVGTARAIGVSPSFAILGEAILINEDSENTGSPLDLESAANEGIKKNLSIIAGQLGVRANLENVAIARSVLLPQVQSSITMDWNKNTYPTVKNGSVAERYTDGAIALSQILFSETALANLSIQQHLHVASEAQQHTLELDIVESTTTSFLNVLVAETQLNIQKDNLSLARENLELAKDRVQTGKVDVSDVYRWESEIATARQNVLAAKANVEQKRDTLNFYLHRPINERFLVEPATLVDPDSIIRHKELPSIINNPRSFNLMGDFLVKDGIDRSPELAQIKAQLKAQERQLLSDRLSFISPDVSFTTGVDDMWSETRKQGISPSLQGEVNWEAGIEVSFPLFEGGKRVANLSQAKYLVKQLKTQYDQMREQIEESVRAQLHAIRASYPSIEISAQGAEAARKNYELVRDQYARGKCSIVELLDAQKASLNSDQTAANAVYTYFIDLMKLQRSVGEYYFFLSGPIRDKNVARMLEYISNGGKS